MGSDYINIVNCGIELFWLYKVEILIGFLFGFIIFIAFYAELIIKDRKTRIVINFILGGLITAFILKNELMDAQIITILGGFGSIVLGYALKEWSNSKAQNRKELKLAEIQEAKEVEQLELKKKEKDESIVRENKLQKLVLGKLEDVEVLVTNIEIKLEAHIKDTDFKAEFKKSNQDRETAA